MKYVDEFRNRGPVQNLIKEITERSAENSMSFMEVCGTHTMAIARHGLRNLLPKNISLISGPGCPVCVTPNSTVDHAIALAGQSDVIVATFGDMLKVPGSKSSLDAEHARGGDVRVVASTLEALDLAESHLDKKVVFLGVGFETTVPTIAASLIIAKQKCLKNYFVLAAHKTMPEAMAALSTGDVAIDGYLCPGHVSAITGSSIYEFLAEKFNISCVIGGFEPLDILQSISMLVTQVAEKKPRVVIQYSRVVKPEGNPIAQKTIDQVFEPCDSYWRGIGVIPGSGLKIRSEFSQWDAEIQLPVPLEPAEEPSGCLCGQILQGKVKPPECGHFGKGCTPGNPIGPCMVSSEGTCAAYFRYHVS